MEEALEAARPVFDCSDVVLRCKASPAKLRPPFAGLVLELEAALEGLM